MTKPWTSRLRLSRASGLILSVGLLSALGVSGVAMNQATTATVEEARRTDGTRALMSASAGLHAQLQSLVATLTDPAKEQRVRFADGDPHDLAIVTSIARTAPEFARGVALSDPTGHQLSLYSTGTIPAADDPGYLGMTTEPSIVPDMSAEHPTTGLLSSVLTTEGDPLVAVAAAFVDGKSPPGAVVGYIDLRSEEARDLFTVRVDGPLREVLVLDRAGRIVMAAKPDLIGQLATEDVRSVATGARGAPAIADRTVGGTPSVVGAIGALPGGWSLVGIAPVDEYYGPIRDRGRQINLTLAALVLFTAIFLVFTGLRADSVLRRSEERFRALVQHGSDVIAVLDADGAVLFLSPSFTTVLGHDLADAPACNARDYVHPDDYDSVVAAFREMVAGAGTGSHSTEVRVLRADGTHAWMDVSLTDMRGSAAGGVVVNARDTDDSRRLREELRRQATVDALTGAGNRRMLYERLTQELDGSDGRVTVLYIDLDRFKPVNDRFGHDAGDELLRQAVERVRGCVRAEDTLARAGGDEFVVVATGLQPGEAEVLAGRIAAALAEQFVLADGVVAEVGGSVGIGVARATDGPDDVLGRADGAMYRAKHAGGGRHSRTGAQPEPVGG